MALDPGLTVAGSVGILFLTLASAFFSSSELAIFSLARHRVDALASGGGPGPVPRSARSGRIPTDCW